MIPPKFSPTNSGGTSVTDSIPDSSSDGLRVSTVQQRSQRRNNLHKVLKFFNIVKLKKDWLIIESPWSFQGEALPQGSKVYSGQCGNSTALPAINATFVFKPDSSVFVIQSEQIRIFLKKKTIRKSLSSYHTHHQ